jgi:hypothetical protein
MSEKMGVIVVSFDDLVRAEQAARATDYWRQANPSLPIGPITVVGRTPSGSVAVSTSGVIRPRSGARQGFWVGLILIGLPAAGIAGFVGWILAAVLTSLLSLTGLVNDDVASFITFAVAVGFAVVVGLVLGLLGGLVGACVGALIGLADSRLRGFPPSEVGSMASHVSAGNAIVAVSAGAATAPIVTDELLRLGGTPNPLTGQDSTPKMKGTAKTDVASG